MGHVGLSKYNGRMETKDVAETPEFKNLTLDVANFGPIERASIDLRPLTVFVGPSNTGKSYLAILIYALHKFFSGDFEGRTLRQGIRRASVFGTLLSHEPSDTVGLSHMLRESMTEGNDISEVVIPERVARNLVQPSLRNLPLLEEDLGLEMVRAFGAEDLASLKRHRGKSPTSVTVGRSFQDPTRSDEGYSYEILLGDDSVEMSATILDELNAVRGRPSNATREGVPLFRSLPLRFLRGNDDQENTHILRRYLAELTDMVGAHVFDPLTAGAYYLPADRAGIMHAHRVVVSSLYRKASRAGIDREAALPTLSGVLADFLEQLLNMEDAPLRRSRSRDTALGDLRAEVTARIQEEILRGAVRREVSSTGYPVYSYRPTGWDSDVPLMSASSMVTELAPIVLYLRNVVKPGEVLIIEEPESHLHPAMQVEMLRQLSRVVQAGVRIILTTHSEWVLEELANLVRLSDLPEDKREGIAGAGAALKQDQVGAWLFQQGNGRKGSIVAEMPLDIQRGSYETGYGLVTEDLYDRWVTINQRIDETGPDG